jgi:hypothetical protein
LSDGSKLFEATFSKWGSKIYIFFWQMNHHPFWIFSLSSETENCWYIVYIITLSLILSGIRMLYCYMYIESLFVLYVTLCLFGGP